MTFPACSYFTIFLFTNLLLMYFLLTSFFRANISTSWVSCIIDILIYHWSSVNAYYHGRTCLLSVLYTTPGERDHWMTTVASFSDYTRTLHTEKTNYLKVKKIKTAHKSHGQVRNIMPDHIACLQCRGKINQSPENLHNLFPTTFLSVCPNE